MVQPDSHQINVIRNLVRLIIEHGGAMITLQIDPFMHQREFWIKLARDNGYIEKTEGAFRVTAKGTALAQEAASQPAREPDTAAGESGED